MKCPDIYAIYLPQYHETENNNKWWGKGYTEWTAVKNAEPLFEGHLQPKKTLNENYYNLLEKKTMKEQAELAEKYGVNGFIFYHYYFDECHLELEKPAENLLKWTDINMPFCFEWANESWIRTWSKWNGNAWFAKANINNTHEGDGVLVKQKYGTKKDWKEHFNYLLPFFKDSRYIRIENKPVFIIYKPDDIGLLTQMISYWQELAIEAGLEGVYIIGQKTWYNNRDMDALMLLYTVGDYRKQYMESIKIQNGVRCIDYEDFMKKSIEVMPLDATKTYFGIKCGYDNTPRHGRYGDVLYKSKPEIFEKYLIELIKKTIKYDNKFLFINAWNEWGEGMYLEPDEENKYAYLEAIKNARVFIEKLSCIDELESERISHTNIQNASNRNTRKYNEFYNTCSIWIDLLLMDTPIFKPYFARHNIKTIAIYGMANMGKKLYKHLKKDGIDVSYAIDQTVSSMGDEICIYRPDEERPYVDLIIITAYDEGEIKNKLKMTHNGLVISLIELLQAIISDE